MKLTQEQLAKMSEDVFASNPEDKFWATEDGNFFPKERDAIAHAKGQPIIIFERKVTEEVTEVVTTKEVTETATETEVVTKEEVTEVKLPVTENKTPKTGKK